MKFFDTKALCGVVLAVSMLACTQPDTNSATKIDAASIVQDKTLTPADKAERLAKASEQLLTAQGFVYAEEIADLALTIDANNLRAQFIKVLVGPLMATKGVVSRAKPLFKSHQAMQDYNKKRTEFENSINSNAKTMWLEGNEDIVSDEDVQAFVDAQAEAWGNLRQFAKNNKDKELTLTGSDTMWQGLFNRYEGACIIKNPYAYRYEYDCPDIKNLMDISLNRADFEAIQHLAGFAELYISLMNSYDISGSVALANDLSGQKTYRDEVLDTLLKGPRFAVLRQKHGFSKVKDLAADAILGARWAIDNQKDLCSYGYPMNRNRYGHLFSNGFCLGKKSPRQALLDLLAVEDVLNGSQVSTSFASEAQESGWCNKWYGGARCQTYATSIRPSTIINKPIEDLKAFAPVKINRCHDYDNYGHKSFEPTYRLAGISGDMTVGGLFPLADVNTALEVNGTCIWQTYP